ncbi:MAG: inner membrane-spanning protein YciB [Hyphomicrobiaceae bacterium]
MTTTSGTKHWYPFNSEQTVNIIGEIGPLVIFFIVNGVAGVEAGTWSLIISTVLSLLLSLLVLGRPPIMPFIAGAVSITFGFLALYTGDTMWVQLKVTIFNTLVAIMLWVGLQTNRNFFYFVFGKTFHYTPVGWHKMTRNVAWFFLFTAIINEVVRLAFDGVEIEAMDRVLTGIDIWVLFKLFIIMPLTAVFFWWQVRVLQQYRLPDPVTAAVGSTRAP